MKLWSMRIYNYHCKQPAMKVPYLLNLQTYLLNLQKSVQKCTNCSLDYSGGQILLRGQQARIYIRYNKQKMPEILEMGNCHVTESFSDELIHIKLLQAASITAI
jgi:hypothetical protein